MKLSSVIESFSYFGNLNCSSCFVGHKNIAQKVESTKYPGRYADSCRQSFARINQK